MKAITAASTLALALIVSGVASARPGSSPTPAPDTDTTTAEAPPYEPPAMYRIPQSGQTAEPDAESRSETSAEPAATSNESVVVTPSLTPVSRMSGLADYWSNMNIGATARIGTLGFGAELSASLIPDRLNLRTGLNRFSFDYEDDGDDGGDDELIYEGSLDLASTPLLLDFHPFKGAFRLSAGFVFNGNELTATARCEGDSNGECEFGDEKFDKDTIGTTKLNVDMGGTHGYLGIGWGNAAKSSGRFTAAFDIGVVMHDPTVTITPSDNCRNDADCNAEVQKEEAELQEDADDFKMYPVLSFGLGYRFK